MIQTTGYLLSEDMELVKCLEEEIHNNLALKRMYDKIIESRDDLEMLLQVAMRKPNLFQAMVVVKNKKLMLTK